VPVRSHTLEAVPRRVQSLQLELQRRQADLQLAASIGERLVDENEMLHQQLQGIGAAAAAQHGPATAAPAAAAGSGGTVPAAATVPAAHARPFLGPAAAASGAAPLRMEDLATGSGPGPASSASVNPAVALREFQRALRRADKSRHARAQSGSDSLSPAHSDLRVDEGEDDETDGTATPASASASASAADAGSPRSLSAARDEFADAEADGSGTGALRLRIDPPPDAPSPSPISGDAQAGPGQPPPHARNTPGRHARAHSVFASPSAAGAGAGARLQAGGLLPVLWAIENEENRRSLCALTLCCPRASV
jgi:hypothetical protein